jgi:hypothetical protein
MKKFSLIAAMLLFCLAVLSQVPQAFKYQAVARDASGNVLANKPVAFRISIVPGSATGSPVFTETHAKTTNGFGLVDLEIGTGTNVLGSISSIEWASKIYFFKVELDPAGGTSFISMGTSQLLSVPYAQHAVTVEIDKVDDADNDPMNEIQQLMIAGNEITLSNGGGSVNLPEPPPGDNWGDQVVQTNISLQGDGTNEDPLRIDNGQLEPIWSNVKEKPEGFDDNIDNYIDDDSDPLNEIQALSLSGSDLTLSKGGGTVTLPLSDLGDNWGTQTVQTDATLTGNGTSTSALKIAQQGATTGQALKWNGTGWYPGNDITGNSQWVQSGDNIYFNTGNVGVGKNPGADNRKLQVLAGNSVGFASVNNSLALPSIWAENEAANYAATFSNTGGPVAWFKRNITIQDGTQGEGKVLTSDANGITSWQTPSAGPWVIGTTGTEYVYTDRAIGVRAIPFNSAFLFNGTGFSNGGTVVFSGSLEPTTPSTLPTLTTYVRMLWYPNKVAFRAGSATGVQWNRENIGYYSIAFGLNCTASGSSSLASGYNSSATNNSAVSLGYSNVSSGQFTLSTGYNTNATGDASASFNNGTTASGSASAAFNYQTTATGNYSVAFNNGTTASGTTSTAFGWQCTASGSYSFASGYSSTASGLGSMAFGLNTTSSSNYSTTMGSNTTASGFYSLAAGYLTIAPSLCETVIGMYNTTYSGNPNTIVSTNRLFVVGNGTSTSDRSNALTILKNGRVGIGVDAPTYTLAVSGTAAKTGGGSWSVLSDRRLKDIQGEYSKGLNELCALQPVMFTYKKDNPMQLDPEEQQIGFIAQEVQAIFPEAVSENSSGYLDFNIHPVNVALINAIKELKNENDRLKAENMQIINRLSKLEAAAEVNAMK